MPKPKRPLDAHRRALTVLAGSPDGCTEAILLAHGFPVALLAELVRAGLATATVQRVLTGSREMKVTCVQITDLGRKAMGMK